MQIMYAISSAVFAAIFLVGIMAFGGEWSRALAIAAAFLACASQFMAQDHKSYKASIYSAYASFAAGLLAYLWLIFGH